jgi:hypothetical protein
MLFRSVIAGEKLLPAVLTAEVPGLTVALGAECGLLIYRHATNGIDRHVLDCHGSQANDSRRSVRKGSAERRFRACLRFRSRHEFNYFSSPAHAPPVLVGENDTRSRPMPIALGGLIGELSG